VTLNFDDIRDFVYIFLLINQFISSKQFILIIHLSFSSLKYIKITKI